MWTALISGEANAKCFCVNRPSVRSQTVIFSRLDTRQEHCESQMLRKRVKELETEYKQLQLECQVTESRVVELESEVEVSLYTTLE